MKRAKRWSPVTALTLILSIAPPLSPSAAAGSNGEVPRLDGRRFAYWAHPQQRASVRQLPSQASRPVARLHYLTEDGFPEVYPVLRRFTDRTGHRWLGIAVPMRPHGRVGWVRESVLGPLYRVRTRLMVDRMRMRAVLYRSGRRIWRSPIGVGRLATPTPAGHFWIRERFRVADPGGPYGPRAFGTSAYSRLSDWPGGGVIGIHGTNDPGLIPDRPSSGCIRVPNRAIGRLYRLMPIGTPVKVR